MIKNSIFTAALAIMAGVAVSCSSPTDTPPDIPPVIPPVDETLDTPTELAVGEVTATAAALSWTAVDGAEKYNVVIGDMEAVDVADVTYDASGLTAETVYIWKVRAVKGDIVSDWASGPGFTTPEESSGPPPTLPTPVPTDLEALDVTDKSAMLTWQHVDADFHDLIVNGGAPIRVDEPTYKLKGLIPETKYIWEVRSNKNGVWSSWVKSEFTTLEDSGVIQFLGGGPLSYYDTVYGDGTQNFQFVFVDWDPASPPYSRFELLLDICFSRSDLDVDSGRATLDVPNTTYPVSTVYTGVYGSPNPAPNTIVSYYSDVRPIEGDNRLPYIKITGGSMTVEGSEAAGYHMTFDLELENGDKMIGVYDGPFRFYNPKAR